MKKSSIIAILVAVAGLCNIIYILSFGGNIYTLIISVSLLIFSIANLFGTISSVKKCNRQTELYPMATTDDSLFHLGYVRNTSDSTASGTMSIIKIVDETKAADRKNNKHQDISMSVEVKSKEEFF